MGAGTERSELRHAGPPTYFYSTGPPPPLQLTFFTPRCLVFLTLLTFWCTRQKNTELLSSLQCTELNIYLLHRGLYSPRKRLNKFFFFPSSCAGHLVNFSISFNPPLPEKNVCGMVRRRAAATCFETFQRTEKRKKNVKLRLSDSAFRLGRDRAHGRS